MHMKVGGAFLWCLESNLSGSIGPVPHSRCKHAACLYDGHAYIYGGKDGNVPLKDLWRYNLRSGLWECLKWTGDIPPNLQEHTMVPYQNKLYVFGGNFQFGADPEIPFWVLDVGTMVCKKVDGITPVPEGRRGHSAVIYKDAMYIFAGYIDMRRSSSELWAFSFNTESWRLLKATDGSAPSGRHSHSAIVHGHFMWIYGGLANLQTMNDLWCWDFSVGRWTRVKATQGPPSLEGHSACVLHDLMLIYGGSHDGILQNDLWAFDFVLNVWTKIICNGTPPTPCTKHATLLAIHDDWCSRPLCVMNSAASSLQRAVSFPVSSCSAAQQGTRRLSTSVHLARDATAPKSNLCYVEMDIQNGSCVGHENALSSAYGNNAGNVHTSVSTSPPADADVFYHRSGKSDAVPLLDDAESSFSPLHGVANPIAAESTDGQVSVDSFLDSSFDLIISIAGRTRVYNSSETFSSPNCSSEVSDKTVVETSSSDEGPQKMRHVLAVSLLGTPTKSLKSSMGDKPNNRSRSRSPEQHEESSWVEMEMFGPQQVHENGSSSQEMLIMQDLEDGDVEPKENPSFSEHNEGLRRTEIKKESFISDAAHDSVLSCGSGHYGNGESRSVKEAWASPARKARTCGVQKNGAETGLKKAKMQSGDDQNSPSLASHPVCQTELFRATKITQPHPCPEYCMFVFGGRSSFGMPNLDIRSMSVTRLEITFGKDKE